jgi:hypothetical protein
MGTILAIGIIWWFISRSETPQTRRKQRRALGIVMLGSAAWFLASVFNADKHQKY